MPPSTQFVDVVIIGGGIAGLWSLARLRQAGYSVVLLESQRLGGVQTLASQGIIHGGTKYALTGQLTNSAHAIGAMPALWRACLAAQGALDISSAKLLADHQYLWSTGNIGSTLIGLLASQAMRSRVTAVDANIDRPLILQNSKFSGHVYRLEEPVLDITSLSQALLQDSIDTCLRLHPQGKLRLQDGKHPNVELVDPEAGTLRIQTRRVLLTAGAGNQALLAGCGRNNPAMQLRPLHMLMARGQLPPFYAHCLGVGTSPRLTITSHPLSGGEWVWYIGGQIAESGVKRTPEAQIAMGKQELAAVFPWLDLTTTCWATWKVDRAEPHHPSGLRPDQPFLDTKNGISVAWPTKLAFAPVLSAALLESLAQDDILPSATQESINWPRPLPPQLPWEGAITWS